MAVKLGSLRADIRRETDGDWVEIPDLPGVALKVRSFAYGPFQMQKSIVEGKWNRRYGRDPVPIEVSLPENGKLYAQHILVDWRGLVDDDGKPVPIEQAEDILSDPAFRELHEHIRYAGTKLAQIEAEFVEDAAKNSGRSSGGSSAKAQPQNG